MTSTGRSAIVSNSCDTLPSSDRTGQTPRAPAMISSAWLAVATPARAAAAGPGIRTVS
jgi:hypothetical protein